MEESGQRADLKPCQFRSGKAESISRRVVHAVYVFELIRSRACCCRSNRLPSPTNGAAQSSHPGLSDNQVMPHVFAVVTTRAADIVQRTRLKSLLRRRFDLSDQFEPGYYNLTGLQMLSISLQLVSDRPRHTPERYYIILPCADVECAADSLQWCQTLPLERSK